jgi:protein MpaA
MGLASSIAVLAALAATPLSGAGTRVVSLGRSVRHRPIQAEVLGSAQAPRKVVVVGCIHGDECAGVAIVRALARQAPPAGVRLWLVPTLNPDGMAARTRQNADGVDLNRNFPYRWRPLADPVYNSGPRPSSEPETRAAMRLIARIRPSVTIWYHQHEDLVDMSGGDRAIARSYARTAGLRATCLPFLPGTATSWSNHALPGTTAFVVELPAGALTIAQVTRNVRAVHGAELGAHSGSRTSCAA